MLSTHDIPDSDWAFITTEAARLATLTSSGSPGVREAVHDALQEAIALGSCGQAATADARTTMIRYAAVNMHLKTEVPHADVAVADATQTLTRTLARAWFSAQRIAEGQSPSEALSAQIDLDRAPASGFFAAPSSLRPVPTGHASDAL